MRKTRWNTQAKLIGAAGPLLAAAFVLSPGEQATSLAQDSRLKDPKFISEGASLFAPTCGSGYCHGAGGIGGGGPRLRGKGLEASYLFKAISNGIPGTAMLAFKSQLSEEQRWQLVAYIMSEGNRAPVATPASVLAKPEPEPSAARPQPSPVVGSAQAGRSLFFDSTQPKNCAACHSFNGEGASVGPDLSSAGDRSPKELFLSIILPREPVSPRYAAATVTLRSGEKVIGVKKDEDAESIRVYDTAELPAVLRTVQRADIADVKAMSESVMPKDYAAAYTMKQLLDLVTFLKLGDTRSKSGVKLSELF